jgi:2-polyprenyl-3-methyl-5-hydroxy-6-metoxy-1,4-benzoquinol methylase
LSSESTLTELKTKLAQEEELYADLLEKLDGLANIRAPYDVDDSLPPRLESLNQSPALVNPELASSKLTGLKGLARRIVRRFVEPELTALAHALAEQRTFNSGLMQFLNRFAESVNRAAASHAEFTSTLIGFAQRIDRLADAKDRLYASLGNTRADLLLEAMDKRLETVRLGLRQMHDRVEGIDTSLTVARAELRGVAGRMDGGATSEPPPAAATQFEAEHYLAFEERFRGSSEEIRNRLRDYLPDFEGRAPVLDLGCGRGEFLELLAGANVEAKGIDGNREMVHACRDKGLTAEVGDIVSFVADTSSGSAGGIFAAQVVEHLPPSLLRKFIGDCFRTLRNDGRVVLETVNPESIVALVGFYRDLTHQKPLHPETLEFLMRAVGFRDVTIRYTSPVSERARLLRLTERSASNDTLNQNFEKLNALLYGDLDYAVIATK